MEEGLMKAWVFASFFAIFALAADEPAPKPDGAEPPPAKVEMNDLEKQFQKTMSGATLVGRFSTDGKDDQPPGEERYEISKVSKIGKDLWLFTARFGENKLPLPLPLPVKWADDTPVISVTNVKVPGMGMYTARVLIYKDHYAGTWDASTHGGNLWGKLEHAAPK
jgi:hypothetical protein